MRGAVAWLAMRESASRRSRVLPMPGVPVMVTMMGVLSSTHRSNAATICASSASRPTNGAPPTISRRPRTGVPTTRAAVAPVLELEAPARRSSRRARVGEDLAARGVPRERGGAVDHLARRARAIDARAPRPATPTEAPTLAMRSPEIERAERLVAEGLAHAQVRDDGVAPELGRVGPPRTQVREKARARRALGHVGRHDGRDEARPAAAAAPPS